MSGGVVDIGYVELFSASALMLVAGLVSWKLELGQTRRIVVSSVRCFMQLLAAGFLLTYLFEFQTWWLVALVLAAMVIAATQIAVSRVKSRIPGLVPSVFVSLFVSSLVVGFIVVEGVVRADPWFHARQVVPIVGMIMGNAMAAVAVAIDRLFSDLDARASEMFSLTALGATPREAAAPSLKAAIGAGMTPVLANMSAAGIVTFPGMMTGQLLAGADPLSAAKYQIVVMLMLSAANTVAIVTACFMTYRKRFARIIIYNRIDVKGRSVVAGEPKFSHITVTPDDEDDVVIQAGARPTRPADPAPASPCEEEPAPEPEPAAANGSSTDEDARPKREKAGNEGYRETTMDDLKAAPMPLAQKVVLALAAVGVVAIVAWYLFLR